MLSIFDWLRRSRSGAELLAILKYSVTDSDLFPIEGKPGSPLSAFDRPCRRCWIYPCMTTENPDMSSDTSDCCRSCQAITDKAKTMGHTSRQAIIVWGFVTHIPEQLQAETKKGFYAEKVIGSYIHDENHFLLTIHRRELKTWLQELLIYEGTALKGLIQVFPTTGEGKRGTMGEILCRAVHQEARFPMNMLRVRFFSSPFQVFAPHTRDDKGLLTFEATEFLRLLEMAEIFRSLLKPDEQKALQQLIGLKDKREEQFYWGRFMGHLSQEAKDMLGAWKIRQWSAHQLKLLYELIEYASYKIS